jgi:hypothetical protein
VTKPRLRLVLASTLVLATAGCNRNSAAPADAQHLANALTGDDQASAASNPQCKLFTPEEIAAFEGTPVAAGKNAAMGMACQWTDVQGNDSAMLQVVRASDHEPASGAPGFKALPDIGKDGFIVPQMGGWHAAAISGSHSVNVLTGGKSDEARTIAFLKEAIKRAGQ